MIVWCRTCSDSLEYRHADGFKWPWFRMTEHQVTCGPCTIAEFDRRRLRREGVRTITSIDQLNNLPKFTVLRYGYTSRAGLKQHEIWEQLEGGWYCIGAATSPPMGDYGTPSLPATLIWHPNWETT